MLNLTTASAVNPSGQKPAVPTSAVMRSLIRQPVPDVVVKESWTAAALLRPLTTQ